VEEECEGRAWESWSEEGQMGREDDGGYLKATPPSSRRARDSISGDLKATPTSSPFVAGGNWAVASSADAEQEGARFHVPGKRHPCSAHGDYSKTIDRAWRLNFAEAADGGGDDYRGRIRWTQPMNPRTDRSAGCFVAWRTTLVWITWSGESTKRALAPWRGCCFAALQSMPAAPGKKKKGEESGDCWAVLQVGWAAYLLAR
jgi:hypothetical protein